MTVDEGGGLSSHDVQVAIVRVASVRVAFVRVTRVARVARVAGLMVGEEAESRLVL